MGGQQLRTDTKGLINGKLTGGLGGRVEGGEKKLRTDKKC